MVHASTLFTIITIHHTFIRLSIVFPHPSTSTSHSHSLLFFLQHLPAASNKCKTCRPTLISCMQNYCRSSENERVFSCCWVSFFSVYVVVQLVVWCELMHLSFIHINGWYIVFGLETTNTKRASMHPIHVQLQQLLFLLLSQSLVWL